MTRPRRAPKQLYWVEILPGSETLPYRQPGGGVFSTLAYAQDRCVRLNRIGILTQIHVTEQIEWSPVPTEVDA